jgi:hypothetical protein
MGSLTECRQAILKTKFSVNVHVRVGNVQCAPSWMVSRVEAEEARLLDEAGLLLGVEETAFARVLVARGFLRWGE